MFSSRFIRKLHIGGTKIESTGNEELKKTPEALAQHNKEECTGSEELMKKLEAVLARQDSTTEESSDEEELLDELQGTDSLLAIEKEKCIKIEDELSKIKREACEESERHEKTKNELRDVRVELERQKKLLSEAESNFLRDKTKSLLQEQITKSLGELTVKRNRLEELEKLYSQMLRQNETLKLRQSIITKDFEKFRQWDEEQASNNHYLIGFTEFSYAGLKEATDDFHDKHKIGTGGYGTVYKGVLHGTPVAIKVIKKEDEQGEREFKQEIEVIRKLRHPNLIKLIGACHENWALVYEFLPEGSLENCLRNAECRKSLSWETRIQIASGICSALAFLHQTKPHGIAHGDLKPDNILLDSRYACKLIDFGTCRKLKLTDTTKTPHHATGGPRGTFCYIDPEYIESYKITPQSDVFSFGVVLLQLVTGKEPMSLRMFVQKALECGRLNEVVDASANWPLEVAEKMARLGLRCIDRFSKNRPDLAEEVWVEIESVKQFASSS